MSVWGILAEVGPWPCPLTLLEQHVERLAGIQSYSGSFIVHYLDAIVYPRLPVDLVIGAGVSGMVAFVGHAFYADSIARSIGWQPGSPFQFEIAVTNLSYGVLGLMCIWIRGPFWLATGVGNSVLLLGCNYGHLYDAFAKGNYALNNYGLINVFEIVWPALVLVLLVPYMRSWASERAARTT